jgi:RND family efflux transporter MFP subunit
MNKDTFLRTLVLLPAILFIQACSEPPRTANAGSATTRLQIHEFTVQMQQIPLLYSATGTIHARVESQLAGQLMARVLSVRVHEGDRVSAGQTLITLDSQETEAAYRKAEAGRAEAQSGIAETENSIAAAKANLDLAKVTAQRMKDLYEKRSISQQEFDETYAKLQTAQANYEMAKARRTELTDRIAQSDASLQEAQVSRSYTAIRAPFSGVITARNVEPGALAVPGTSLLTIEAGNGYRLHAYVEESRLSLVHLKDKVNVSLDAPPGDLQGQVGEISPSSDSSSHSYRVKIDLPSTAALHAGQFGHVSFSAGNKQAIAVPLAAVVETGQLTSVFVDDGSVARTRLITLGKKYEGQVEVLSGLQAGEQVIYPVPVGLTDGDKVEAQQ